jgi:hypothetical protein
MPYSINIIAAKLERTAKVKCGRFISQWRIVFNARDPFAGATSGLAIICVMGIPGAGIARGQVVTQISGLVKDETGAAVPGAEVTATQTGTGYRKSATTDNTGFYILTNMPLGPYRSEATRTGFRTYVQTGIELQVGTAPEIPITLAVGQVSESVSVEANASQVEARNVGVGTVIETERIVDLPLNGRQPTDLITLSGASVNTGASPGYGMRTGALISGFWEWDGAFSREFATTERQRFQIRVEGFNITNGFHPGNPGLSTGSANTFGVITTDATPPSATTARHAFCSSR